MDKTVTSHQSIIPRNQEPVTGSQWPEADSQKFAGSRREQEATQRPFIVPIFIPHAGCRHRCVFCNQSSITGIRSKPSRSDIRGQIEAFLKYKRNRHSPVQIAFFGGNFLGMPTAEIRRLLAVGAEYVYNDHADGIRFSTRPDTIDCKRLNMIKHFPISTIELGVQSMNNEVLLSTKRGHNSADSEKAVHLVKKFGYEIGIQLMVGLPGDNPGRLLVSAQQVARLKPDFIRIYPAVVLAASPLATLYAKGSYVPLRIEEAVSLVKNLYLLFKSENIRVIRMGLQASPDLDKGANIIAGPYHPAFGHLVYSAVFFDLALAALKSGRTFGEAVALHVHPQCISKMRGLENKNIKRLKEKFKLKSIKVIPDASLSKEEIQLHNQVQEIKTHRFRHL